MPHRFFRVVLGLTLAVLLLGAGAAPADAFDDPPADSDGVYDDSDLCPFEPGLPEYNGCPVPDSDGDGVTDDVDLCPYEYGDSSYGGCPYVPPPVDSDGDGLTDDVDACPDLPGPYDGCPLTDLDGDGVYDDGSDLCPNEFGLPEYNGCPAPDSDGDGVNDDVDQCDETPAGTPIDGFGCSLPVDVTATPPTFADRCGTKLDTVTVPTSAGVAYLRHGDVVAAGTYRVWNKVTVSAVAVDGYVLSGTTKWSQEMTDVACPQGLVKVRSLDAHKVRIVNREAVEMTIRVGSNVRRLDAGEVRAVWSPSGVQEWTARWKSPLISARSGSVHVL